MTRIIRTPSSPFSKPPSIPPSTETSRALVPVSKQEAEWKKALEGLEHQMISYQNLVKGGKATEQDAEGVSEAFENVADSHTDPEVKAHFKKKAEEFREADPKEREEILENILKGFLTLLATPVLAVGAALFTAGMILRGVGLGLKLAGQFALKTIWGGSKRLSTSGDSTDISKKQ